MEWKMFLVLLLVFMLCVQMVIKDSTKVVSTRTVVFSQTPTIYSSIEYNPAELATEHTSCSFDNCFDYSRCSLSKPFSVYFYDTKQYKFADSEFLAKATQSIVSSYTDSSLYVTKDAGAACVFVMVIGRGEGDHEENQTLSDVQSLPYWRDDGVNHIIINIADSKAKGGPILGRSITAQTIYQQAWYRPNFDVIIPPNLGLNTEPVQLPYMLPARRKHLISFQGQLSALESQEVVSVTSVDCANKNSLMLESQIVEYLKHIQEHNKEDDYLFSFDCKFEEISGYNSEWSLCESETERPETLKHSTFSLIIAPIDKCLVSSNLIQIRIFEAFQFGAVPVILGSYIILPLYDLIQEQYKKAVLVLPKARTTELHEYLHSFTNADILEFRKQGRLIWETYMSTSDHILDSVLTTVRSRINLPPIVMRSESVETYPSSKTESTTSENNASKTNGAPYVGPVEKPFPSVQLPYRWFTSHAMFYEYPSNPFHPEFSGFDNAFGSMMQPPGHIGKRFLDSLAGNWAKEQFTIVMLTYNREDIVTNSVARLKGLPHLNRVIVVWNYEKSPSNNFNLPDINVPVHVVRAKKNCLSNRFFPYEMIETDAIFSIDDDVTLIHEDIVFAFRVWRENRDRLVGIPARYHAWNDKTHMWNYRIEETCQISMVLTGAAFFHKYYAYMYSYTMPQAIRDMVYKFMNCEDIAMNFLVSHLSKKPPIKITTKWNFKCSKCGRSALSLNKGHMNERNSCLNTFAKVYGYMPLLYSQYRAESMLSSGSSTGKKECLKFN